MPNFSIALTGLEANSTALNTIGNNLANLNTTAYKGQSTTFEDLFYQQVGSSGSNDPIQVGVGTKVSATATSFAQGTIETTSNSTDMALSGDGFFVVNEGGQQLLTRAGNFQLTTQGALVTTDGANVMGYPAVNGELGLNSTLTALTLPIGQSQSAVATQNMSMTTNLNSSAAIGSDFRSPVTVYDSLGQSHVATVDYTKTSATTWDYSVTLPAGDNTGAPAGNTGTLTFDSTGKLVSPASNTTMVSFPGMSDGASDLNFNLNWYSASGVANVSQSASANNTSTSSQDGYASGVYQSFTVDTQGVITASYSNGNTSLVGQVAVASVANEDGLVREGGNNFATTLASGSASAGVANTGGRAQVEDDSLEDSNVDISAEFSNLIVAQRAFEANSKTVTTFDTVTQDAIGMIR